MADLGTAEMNGVAFRAARWITHERLDDEVIAIDLETGAYFAMEGVAAHVWSVLDGGACLDDAITSVVEHYEVATARAHEDVERLFVELEKERLIEQCAESCAVATVSAAAEHRRYDAPFLEKFGDLEELLLIDPIHEVDEAGWPIRRDT